MRTQTHHTNQIDMLHGPLLGKILLFALPLAASSILQQLFNSADVAVAGRFAGYQAQAAVGVNSPVINLLINLFVGPQELFQSICMRCLCTEKLLTGNRYS